MNLSREEIKRRVEDIIHDFNLQKCKNTIVGTNIVKGMSGGEKRRTSIAIELVTNPQILFLDEPTSGLDSFTAQKVISSLINYASKGMTVVATIHQPNSDTFQKFPKLLLLMDGHTIYQGKTMDSVGYFNQLGYIIPEYSNPSDYYLKEFYIPFISTKTESQKLK